MHEVQPRVFLVAMTQPHQGIIRDYLDSLESELGEQWILNHPNPSGEEIVEFAGRLCYNSFAPGLNPNVTKIRTNVRDYLKNLIEQHHGSTFEHVSMTFLLQNVSRVLTHELVRHRVGVAYSQESMRYVRLTDLGFWFPTCLQGDEHKWVRNEVIYVIQLIEQFLRAAYSHYKLDDPATPFHVKKEITSALRRVVPMGVSTNILVTMNLRALRHIVEMRTDPAAEEEIRIVANKIMTAAAIAWPNLTQDYTEKDGCWSTEHRKI